MFAIPLLHMLKDFIGSRANRLLVFRHIPTITVTMQVYGDIFPHVSLTAEVPTAEIFCTTTLNLVKKHFLVYSIIILAFVNDAALFSLVVEMYRHSNSAPRVFCSPATAAEHPINYHSHISQIRPLARIHPRPRIHHPKCRYHHPELILNDHPILVFEAV